MGPHGRVVTWQIAVPRLAQKRMSCARPISRDGTALPRSPVARPPWHPPNHRLRARPTQAALSIRTQVENGHEPSSVSHLLRFRADTGWQNEPAWEWQVSSAPSPGTHDCRSVYCLLRPVRAVVPAQPQPERCRLQICVRYRWHSRCGPSAAGKTKRNLLICTISVLIWPFWAPMGQRLCQRSSPQ